MLGLVDRRALVVGGSGTVGAEVVRALVRAGVATTFTYCRDAARAHALVEELGATALPVDLRDSAAVRALVNGLPEPANTIIHCAAVGRFVPLADLTDEDWESAHAVNCRSAFVICQAAAKTLAGGDVVLVGALDRSQSLPLPVHFAASQGMLAGLTLALAKELGPATRVNMVALGPLEDGLSRDLSPKLLGDYKKYSALQRLGTAPEAARTIAWLALENRYMSGKVLSVNGGI
jgi:3-oxoacyl-[acyl-carrier protein] reductase